MHNLYAIFAKFLHICKQFSYNLVNEHGNILRSGVIPRFSDLEVSLSLNQKTWKPTFKPFVKARKRIETLFSQMCDQFMMIRNYAKDVNGYIHKNNQQNQFYNINKINNKPIGRVKYALI
ncbi:hypothetical protein D0T85_11480 [Bacteroides sp. 519]|nr:hypothetical protein [Bacteroides sp. 519]